MEDRSKPASRQPLVSAFPSALSNTSLPSVLKPNVPFAGPVGVSEPLTVTGISPKKNVWFIGGMCSVASRLPLSASAVELTTMGGFQVRASPERLTITVSVWLATPSDAMIQTLCA